MKFDMIHPDCLDFVITVEELLNRRQKELERNTLVPSWDYDQWEPSGHVPKWRMWFTAVINRCGADALPAASS